MEDTFRIVPPVRKSPIPPGRRSPALQPVPAVLISNVDENDSDNKNNGNCNNANTKIRKLGFIVNPDSRLQRFIKHTFVGGRFVGGRFRHGKHVANGRKLTNEVIIEVDHCKLSSLYTLPDISPRREEILRISIFEKIRAKDFVGVARILSEGGRKVNIVPKIGCPKEYYIRRKIANSQSADGDTPLIVAARTDFRMVEMILKYGANPNATNNEGDTPLSIAAVRGDVDSVNILLKGGADLNSAVIKLTSYLRFQNETDVLHSGFESGFSVKSLTFLLSNDVYLKCRDPFRAAFDVSKSIEAIVDVRDEFRMEFELLIRDADVFAYKMLDHCDRMWEAREVLDRSHGLLKKAIDEGKKRFVGHPFSQQIILEEWYGKVAHKSSLGKIRLALRYLMTPLLLSWYLLRYFLFEKCRGKGLLDSALAEHMRFLLTPYICFVTDIFNYLILLCLLIATCFCPKESRIPHFSEFALWCCTVSRALIESDQMWQQGLRRYLSNMWNVLELVSCVLITVAALFRFLMFQTYNDLGVDLLKLNDFHEDILKVTYLYAVTEFLMILRWLNFLEFFPGLGPLLIALRTLIADVFKFVLIVLFTCVIGTAIAVYSVASTVRSQNSTINAQQGWAPNSTLIQQGHSAKKISKFFNDFGTCVMNVIWSTFGRFEEIEVENDNTSTYVVYIILLLYIILAVVLMLNMLIALLNNTFERIQGNCDIEWKYARSRLLKEYRNGQPFTFPFQIFLIPVTILYRSEVDKEYRHKRTMTNKSIEGLTERDQLFCTLCDRYTKSAALVSSSSENNLLLDLNLGAGYGTDRRSSTFATAVALERHNSAMMEAKQSERLSFTYGPTGSRESFETDTILNDLINKSQSGSVNELIEA